MKIARKITAILALLLTLVMIFTGCELLGGTGKLPAHSCENWCIECGKCTDLDCTEDICSEKCDGHGAAPEQGGIGVNAEGKFDLGCVPEPDLNAADFDGYCVINNNVPFFTDAEKATTTCFEHYSSFDSLGRVGVAFACICNNTMPTEDRGGQSYKPTGWVQNSYSIVSGNSLYNRSHLIAWSLAGENDTKENLATGTAYMNQHTMQIFENMVLNYMKSNKATNKVLYRVTPVFNGNNLLCSGVLMEAYSLDDGGEDIQFCVFVYNVQNGVHLDYATGHNRLATSSDSPYYGTGAGFATSGNQGGNSGNEGGNTGNEGGNTGNEGGTTVTPIPGDSYIISANNANGPIYFKGTITSGRFDCSTNVADAVEVTVSTVEGGYVLSFVSGGVTQYIVMGDSSTGGAFTQDAAAATVFEWNADLNTYVVAEDNNNRGFGVGKTSTYENLCAYDTGSTATAPNYNWGVFTKAEGGTTNPDQGGNSGNEGGNQGGSEVTGVVTHKMTDVFGSSTITTTSDYVSADNLITYSLVNNKVAYNRDGTYRVYQDKTALILATKGISAMSFNGKGKDGGEATVTIRVSTDGANWETLESVVVSAKADYSFDFGGSYTYIEITSAGKQLQINSFTYTVSE